jgi:hypothetical protein
MHNQGLYIDLCFVIISIIMPWVLVCLVLVCILVSRALKPTNSISNRGSFRLYELSISYNPVPSLTRACPSGESVWLKFWKISEGIDHKLSASLLV